MEVCYLVLQILTLYFRPKNIIFHTCFQNWPFGRNYVVIDLSTNKKILQIHFEIERTNTFIHSRSPLKTIPDSRPKWAKVFTRFQTKTAQKPNPMGQHIMYITYTREYPPPPRRLLTTRSLLYGRWLESKDEYMYCFMKFC